MKKTEVINVEGKVGEKEIESEIEKQREERESK